METNNENLEMYRGDSKALNLAFTDDNDAVIDITGATIVLTVKERKNDLDAAAILQKTVISHTDADAGLSQVLILASETQNLAPKVYFYDIQITLASGNKKTVAFGDFKVLKDITRV